tara:strand:- start:157 stop:579 length:423 start_codon:yes stop_codon:yes gene_type:complete
MGCDIHLHTEAKIAGVWEHLNAPRIDRNYELFGFLAGVRVDDPPEIIAKPRGLPSNISTVTAFDAKRWGEDGHSHSHINAAEILLLDHWFRRHTNEPKLISMDYDITGYLFGTGWADWSQYPNERPEGIEDIRFVFWFDN